MIHTHLFGQTHVIPDERVEWRKQWIQDLFSKEFESSTLSAAHQNTLMSVLKEYHEVFCLGEGERGETDAVEVHIDTGDVEPRTQPARRIPFAVWQEVACQLQDYHVIQPSNSPWASPIVLVRKKDGSLHLCIDYHALNVVTKPDRLPIPRIDDLVDQLGKSQFFTTLDSALGYWQVKVDKESQEKTAFITHRGLHEFRVMPFGLTNAPTVFQ